MSTELSTGGETASGLTGRMPDKSSAPAREFALQRSYQHLVVGRNAASDIGRLLATRSVTLLGMRQRALIAAAALSRPMQATH
jgi:hypothetical protein